MDTVGAGDEPAASRPGRSPAPAAGQAGAAGGGREGAATDDSAPVTRLDGDDLDEGLRPLDPRVRTLWWSTGALVATAVVAAVSLVDAILPLPLPDRAATVAAAALAGAAAALVPVVRYRRWRYAMRPEGLWIRKGFLTVTVSVIPYRRLQFVDTRQGPLDRMFGLSQLVVHTAALGTSGRLPGLDARQAERLREALARLEPDAGAV